MPESPTATGAPRRQSDSDDPPAIHLSVPSDATPEEAAAIASAIDTHLRQLDRSAQPDDASWHGRRWTFAGRIEALGGPPVRVPQHAPIDPWTAAGRTDRYS